MTSIFKYNRNAKCSAKYLKGGYTGKDFLVLNVYLNEKGPPVKIQQLNIFNDHHIVPNTGHIAIGYDNWPLSHALSTTFYNADSKKEHEISQYLYMC